MANCSYDPDAFEKPAVELKRLAMRARAGRRGFVKRMKSVGLRKGMRAMDLGCGEGTLTLRLASFCAPGDVYGLDSSERCLRLAREKAASLEYPNLSFLHGSAEAIPLPDASVDFVHARLVFQHLSRPANALSEIRRVLSPGGVLVVEDIDHGMALLVPEREDWKNMMEHLQAGQIAAGGNPQIGRQLPGLLREADFRDIRTDVTTAHAHASEICRCAEVLLPSLIDYITEPDWRASAEAVVRSLASPEMAAVHDLYLSSFWVVGRKAE